jgi:hypothetical protein
VALEGRVVNQKEKAMKTETVAEISARIEREATERKVQEVRRVETMKVGAVVRQGDIYVHRVAKGHPRGGKTETRQLARGVTRGSRHMLEAPAKAFEGTTVPSTCRPGTLLGPFVESERRVRITHPEHAWIDLPAGAFQITYQRDARTGAAVQD